MTWDVRFEERLPTGAPLPSAFRLADDGEIVPTSAGAAYDPVRMIDRRYHVIARPV